MAVVVNQAAHFGGCVERLYELLKRNKNVLFWNCGSGMLFTVLYWAVNTSDIQVKIALNIYFHYLEQIDSVKSFQRCNVRCGDRPLELRGNPMVRGYDNNTRLIFKQRFGTLCLQSTWYNPIQTQHDGWALKCIFMFFTFVVCVICSYLKAHDTTPDFCSH